MSEVPLEDMLGALIELRYEGKLRYIGLLEPPRMVEPAQAITPIAPVQNRFNLINRSGVEVLAVCERNGFAFIPLLPPRHRPSRHGESPDKAGRKPTRHDIRRTSVAASAIAGDHPHTFSIKSFLQLRDNVSAMQLMDRLSEEEV